MQHSLVDITVLNKDSVSIFRVEDPEDGGSRFVHGVIF
jgi:hypothetical protein